VGLTRREREGLTTSEKVRRVLTRREREGLTTSEKVRRV